MPVIICPMPCQPERNMSDPKATPDDRAEVLATLRHGIERSLLLAHSLAGDPLIAAEARSLTGRLQSIQAEVEAIACFRERPRRDDDRSWEQPFPIWE